MRQIQDDLQWHAIYDEIRSLLAVLVGSLTDSLTCWLTRWQTDWSDYLDVFIKDSVGTNWMLSEEGPLPVSLLPALHPLQVIHGHCAYQTTALLLKTFLERFRVAWESWLESYSPRHTSVVLWYNIVCVYCKSVHLSRFSVQLCMTTKLMYRTIACYTTNNGFTANDTLFYMYKSKVS